MIWMHRSRLHNAAKPTDPSCPSMTTRAAQSRLLQGKVSCSANQQIGSSSSWSATTNWISRPTTGYTGTAHEESMRRLRHFHSDAWALSRPTHDVITFVIAAMLFQPIVEREYDSILYVKNILIFKQWQLPWHLQSILDNHMSRALEYHHYRRA